MKISRKMFHKISLCICINSFYCDFWKFIFHKAVYRRS